MKTTTTTTITTTKTKTKKHQQQQLAMVQKIKCPAGLALIRRNYFPDCSPRPRRCVSASYLFGDGPGAAAFGTRRAERMDALVGWSVEARGGHVFVSAGRQWSIHTRTSWVPLYFAHIRTYSKRSACFTCTGFFITFLIDVQTIAKVNKIGFFFQICFSIVLVLAAVTSISAPNASSKSKLGEKRGKNAIFPLSHQMWVRARAFSLGRVLYGRVVMVLRRGPARTPRAFHPLTHVLVFAPRAATTEQRTFPGVRKRGPLRYSNVMLPPPVPTTRATRFRNDLRVSPPSVGTNRSQRCHDNNNNSNN